MSDPENPENIKEELRQITTEELNRRFQQNLSMDRETYELYCAEYARRGLEPPSQEMMDH